MTSPSKPSPSGGTSSPRESAGEPLSDKESGRPAATSVAVSVSDIIAYEDDRKARLARMSRVAPVRAKAPEGWKLPPLNPDGSYADGTSEPQDS